MKPSLSSGPALVIATSAWALVAVCVSCSANSTDAPASHGSGGAGSPASGGVRSSEQAGSDWPAGGAAAGGALAVAGASQTGGGSAGGRTSLNTGGSSGSVSVGTGGVSAAAGSSAGAGAGGVAGMQPFKGVANSPCAARTLLDVSWYYNWTQKETEPCSDARGGAFVPMIWGHTGAEQTAASITSSVTSFVSKNYKYVLGFNEPDNTEQSNIAVTQAISLLPSFDNASILLGTPATQANTAGQAWFKDYMTKVAANAALRADFIAIHWYGWDAGSCDPQASQLESYLKYAEGFAGNRPIWLTEWGCLNASAPTTAGVVDFYKGAVAVFAKHPRLVRYAWYPWSTNCALNNTDGSLTELGQAYAAQPANK